MELDVWNSTKVYFPFQFFSKIEIKIHVKMELGERAPTYKLASTNYMLSKAEAP